MLSLLNCKLLPYIALLTTSQFFLCVPDWKMTTSQATTLIQTIFTIEPFDPLISKWDRWVRRLEGAFAVFKVPIEIQVDYLLHYVGASTYEMVCDKFAPEEPQKKSYEEIIDLMRQHFSPEPLEIAENFRFHQRVQSESEGVQDFLTALQKLAIHCKFGDYLKTALRNQFVFGLRSERIQGRLLEIKSLTLAKAVEIASGMELSARDTSQFHNKSRANIGTVNIKSTFIKKKGNVMTKPHMRSRENQNGETSGITKNNPQSNIKKKCYRCGRADHLANKCTHLNTVCRGCGIRGHLQAVCLKTKVKKEYTNQVDEVASMFSVSDRQSEHVEFRKKIWVNPYINNTLIKMELDSGAAVSIIGADQVHKMLPNLKIMPTKLELISFCETIMEVEGYIPVIVNYKDQVKNLNLYVVKGGRDPLFGREWIRQIEIDWNDLIKKMIVEVTPILVEPKLERNDKQLKELIERYDSVFKPGIGHIKGIQARLRVKENVTPKFIKARVVPFSLQTKIENELDKLVNEGVLKKIDTALWATPIVPVVKPNGGIRICGDFKVTLNPHLVVDNHPLPTIDELFASMAGGDKFTKIDLSQAYLHLEVHPDDQHLLTLNTHKGLFKATRLMFGVASAPAIWQREIEKILQGIEGVTVFLDDIKITGPNDAIHLQRLEEVLQRLAQFDLRINLQKSEFFANKIEYCGYIIDKKGIHRMPAKIKAIQEAPRPQNKTEIRAFVGLINYYGRFFKNLSTLLYPLNKLLRNNVPWKWDKECEKSFTTIKQEMQTADFLCHFDPTLPLALATDASPYGVGAVLSHILPDGTEKPILFASQTLNEVQCKYSQIDKEAYAIIFGVRKFYQYLYGKKFTLITDHKPLIQIFSPTKGLPILTATRMQHYAIFLQAFNYDIKYRKSEMHGNADAMSRLPIKEKKEETYDVADIFQIQQVETLPVTVQKLALATAKDKSLLPLLQGLKTGKQLEGKERFGIDQTEFTLHQGCIVRGARVLIPVAYRRQILEELHHAHFGMVKMKGLARSYCWWQGIDGDIEDMVRDCSDCNRVKNNPIKVSTHIWEPPAAPFERVHIDFAGPLEGSYYFILVDAFSKWPEIYPMENITTTATINICRTVFARYGLPLVLVSDNGSQFMSVEFQDFLKLNGIRHKTGAPYHPATNGQAERYVQVLKQALRCMKTTKITRNVELSKLLLQYRKMPHMSTGQSPSMLLMKREIRSRLDLIVPNFGNNCDKKGEKNTFLEVRDFQINDRVSVRDYIHSEKWKFGKISKRLGKLHYLISLDDGREWKRHIDQIRKIGNARERSVDPGTGGNDSVVEYDNSGWEDVKPDSTLVTEGSVTPANAPVPTTPGTPENIALRRSGRVIRKPNRLNL